MSNCLGTQDGAAVFVAATIDGSATNYPILNDILFENNSWDETTGPIIEAASFKHLIVTKNSVSNFNRAPISFNTRGCIRVEKGTGLSVSQKKWTNGKNVPAPSLEFDPSTTHKVFCQDNQLSR